MFERINIQEYLLGYDVYLKVKENQLKVILVMFSDHSVCSQTNIH